ncbi:MAG: hypothetical protein GF416_00725 [Candidatus Altiarchaeales archaeon]|nr:hypothetical protein [Candidatus Altiarchaeales archaeon]MBD3415641.1 hypothetical protein [Candidatus Altiarchaeales archaeon]
MMLLSLCMMVFMITAGYLILHVDERLDSEERLACSLTASTLILGVSSIPFYGRGLENIVFMPLMFAALAVALMFRGRVGFSVDKRLVLLFVLSLVIKLGLTYMQTGPTTTDSIFHFLASQSLQTGNWFTKPFVDNYWAGDTIPSPLTYRPPLYHIILAATYTLSGVSFQAGQWISSLFGAAIVLPTYLLGKRLFNDRVAYWSAILMALNPYFMHRSLDTEPRTMVAYLTLVTFYFMLKGREYWPYYSISAGLAYLTHFSSMFYLISFMGIYAYTNRKALVDRRTALAAMVFILIISPWFVRNQLVFGSPFYSSSKYLPLLYKTESFNTLEPPTLNSYIGQWGGGPVGVAKVLGVRALNVITGYFPPPHKALDYGLVWMLSGLVPSNVSWLVFIAGLMGLVEVARRGLHPFVVVIVFVSLTGPLTLGYPTSRSVSVSTLHALTPLYTLLGVMWVEKRKDKKMLMSLLVASVVLNDIILFSARGSHGPDAEVMGWLRENTSQDERIMSLDALWITYHTGREGYITPYEPREIIEDAIAEHEIDYLVIGPGDLKLRDIDKGWVEENYMLAHQNGDYSVYRTK